MESNDSPPEDDKKPLAVKRREAVTSSDDMLQYNLSSIRFAMRKLRMDLTKRDVPDRDTMMSLRDCMTMLFEYRKREQEELAALSDEELNKLAGDEGDEE